VNPDDMDVDIQIVPENVKAMFRRMLDKREEVEKLDKKLKREKAELREQEAEAHQALAESVGDPTQGKSAALPIDLGEGYGRWRFLPTATVYGNILDEDKVLEYLENSGQVDEFTRPTLAKGELNALARRLRESNSSFPPGLDYRIQRGVRATKQKGG
jgi:hypothetical protein